MKEVSSEQFNLGILLIVQAIMLTTLQTIFGNIAMIILMLWTCYRLDKLTKNNHV